MNLLSFPLNFVVAWMRKPRSLLRLFAFPITVIMHAVVNVIRQKVYSVVYLVVTHYFTLVWQSLMSL